MGPEVRPGEDAQREGDGDGDDHRDGDKRDGLHRRRPQPDKDAEAHYNLGQAYAGLKLYSEAIREYRQATRLKSDDFSYSPR